VEVSWYQKQFETRLLLRGRRNLSFSERESGTYTSSQSEIPSAVLFVFEGKEFSK
jgi:hypothetical protein